jgi:hypothetical protein
MDVIIRKRHGPVISFHRCESGMHRRTPLGLDHESPSPDGIAPYAGARTPGPTTPATGGSGAADSSSPASDLAEGDALGSLFQVDGQFYRVRRLDTSWYRAPNEVDVVPDEAVGILERAIGRYDGQAGFVRLLQLALTQLAGLHAGGVHVLLWLRPEAPSRAAPAPPPPRSSAAKLPVLPAPPAVEEPMMPLAQAAVLRNAALTGAPFCEECARAAAARGAGPS